MADTNVEALSTLKMLLGIEDSEQDSLLSFLIGDAENLILGHCQIDFIPRQLESLVPKIAADMYRAKGYGSAEAPQIVKSVSQDKRTVSFSENNTSTEDFLKSYIQRLKPFVRKRGRVPSDIR